MITCTLCHTCGHEIRIVLDGEEWCPHCQRFQRPLYHGWTITNATDRKPCLEVLDIDPEYEAMIADVGLHGENASPEPQA